jgi:hypothetical protein
VPRNPITCVLLALALAACGSSPTKPDPLAAEAKRIEGVKLSPEVIDIAKQEGKVELTKDDRVQCEKYKPLGSNRTQYRCRTLAEAVQSKEDNNRAMRKLQTPPPAAHGTLNQ